MALTRLQSTKDFFRVWFTWKNQALLAFFLFVAVVMIFFYLKTPTYTSSAKILLLPTTSEGSIISVGSEEKRVTTVSREDINTEIELLTSQDVIKATVKSFDEKNPMLKNLEKTWFRKLLDLVKKSMNSILIFLGLKDSLSPFDTQVALLKNSLTVEPASMSNMIIIQFKSETPENAPIVLDRLLEVYIKHHNKVYTKQEGISFFEDQVAIYRSKLVEKEKLLKLLQRKYNIVDLKRQNDTNIALIADFQKELNDLELSSDETKDRLAVLRKSLEMNKREVIITKEMRNLPSIVELERSLVPLLVKQSEILRTFTPASRESREIGDQIETLRREIRGEVVRAIKAEELELQVLRTKRESLVKKVEELQDEANDMNEKERILNEVTREVEILKNNYLLYTSKAEEIRIASEREKHDLANVSIGESATMPTKPSGPNLFFLLLVSVVVGSFIAIGLPFLLEFLDHRIKTPAEVEVLTSLPVICSFSDLKTS